MGMNKGLAHQGRFSKDHPKAPKMARCRACRGPLKDKLFHRIGGKHYHKECR